MWERAKWLLFSFWKIKKCIFFRLDEKLVSPIPSLDRENNFNLARSRTGFLTWLGMTLLYRFSGDVFTTRLSIFSATPRHFFAGSKSDLAPAIFHRYNRIKPLAKSLKVSVDVLMKDICVKRRKQFYCNHGGAWFSFPSVNSVIVPFETAQSVAAKYKIPVQLAPALTVNRCAVSSKLPVV